jgi:hypothetical protein
MKTAGSQAVEADSVGGHEAVPAACERSTPQISSEIAGALASMVTCGTATHSQFRQFRKHHPVPATHDWRHRACDTRTSGCSRSPRRGWARTTRRTAASTYAAHTVNHNSRLSITHDDSQSSHLRPVRGPPRRVRLKQDSAALGRRRSGGSARSGRGSRQHARVQRRLRAYCLVLPTIGRVAAARGHLPASVAPSIFRDKNTRRIGKSQSNRQVAGRNGRRHTHSKLGVAAALPWIWTTATGSAMSAALTKAVKLHTAFPT